MIAMSRRSSASDSSAARGTPAKVISGPYMAGVISGSGMITIFPAAGLTQTRRPRASADRRPSERGTAAMPSTAGEIVRRVVQVS